MAEIFRNEISLNSQLYKLAREEDVRRTMGTTARRWHVVRKPVATKIEPRPDVRKGEVEDEYVITWDDWSKGVSGIIENLPSTYYFSNGVDPTTPGAIKSMGILGTIIDSTTDWENYPRIILEYANNIYIVGGRYVWRIDAYDTLTSMVNFGAGKSATDAIIHNNLMVIAMGETEKIYTFSSPSTFTQATDAVYAVHLAVTLDGHLWKAADTNEVRNIDSTDSALTLANWSAASIVGDDDALITDLNARGETLIVSKEEGCFVGSERDPFVNVLPEVQQHTANGQNTLVRGSDIFYTSYKGLIRYTLGRRENVGPEQVFTSANLSVAGITSVPGTVISGTTVDKLGNIWVGTEPSYYPRANPTGFQITTDIGVSYTDSTSAVSNNTLGTVATLSALNTVANGDWFIVGYSAKFYGFLLDFNRPNTTASVLTVQYWNGSAWASFGTDTPVYDRTILSGATLGQDGAIIWANPTLPAAWATSTINGIEAYWVRCSVSVALSATVTVPSCRVLTQLVRSAIWRGRPRNRYDVRDMSIIWDCIYTTHFISQPFPNAMAFSSFAPHKRGECLIVATQQIVTLFHIGENPYEDSLYPGDDAYIYLCRHDGGMPGVNKQFLDFTLKGKSIDANHYIQIHYNLDEAENTWTALTAVSSSPVTSALSGIQGYAVQPRIRFAAITNDLASEVNQLECRFRVLPTYKDEYTAILDISADSGSRGFRFPNPDIQMANLKTAHTAGTITLIDPVGTSVSVTVSSLTIEEYLQDGVEYPLLLAQVRMAVV